MNKLLLVLATRNRPTHLLRTMATTIANMRHPETQIMVCVDSDDFASCAALSHYADNPRVIPSIAKREDTVAEKWNRGLTVKADVYQTMGDDGSHLTEGFDLAILEAASIFPDGIGVVYGRMANASFPEFQAMTAGFAAKLGYLYPPLFPYWFVDHWIDDVAKITGRIALAPVIMDEAQWRPQTGTQEMREPGWWATFFDACYLKRRDEAIAMIGADEFDAPQWQKNLLLRNAPFVEHRSRWINDTVRAQSAQMQTENLPHDERYLRVRNAAVEYAREALDDPRMSPQEVVRFRAILDPPTTAPALKVA